MSKSKPEHPSLQRGLIYFITFLLAACSILYELIIGHTLSLLAANTVIWYSITIGCYLASMGFGAFLCDKIFTRKEVNQTWHSLFLVEIALCLCGASSVFLIHSAHILTGHYTDFATAATIPYFFIPSLMIAVIIGVLSGFELPLLIRLGSQLCTNEVQTRFNTSRVLAADYIGSLAGSISFPLLFLPLLNLFQISLCVALVNATVALYLIFPEKLALQSQAVKLLKELWPKGTVSFLCLALFITALIFNGPLEQLFLKKYYYYREMSEIEGGLFSSMEAFPTVRSERSPYQRVDIVREKKRAALDFLRPFYSKKWYINPSAPIGTYLFLNGDFQVYAGTEDIYHEYFAHIPIIATGRVPGKVLILGAGDGILAHELLKYESLQQITLVELDPEVIHQARTHPTFRAMNFGALDDPRVTTIQGDAFYYLRNSQENYDAIYIDFPSPKDFNLARLYSREFYHFVYQHLNPNGFAVADIPGLNLFTPMAENGFQKIVPENMWFEIQPTLQDAGFKNIHPYMSNLEVANPKALTYLAQKKIPFPNRHLMSAEELAEKETNYKIHLLRTHVYQLQQGFIYMTKSEPVLPKKFWQPQASFYVIDERRYNKAFDLVFPAVESKPSNSIFKPTLPKLPYWYLRYPY